MRYSAIKFTAFFLVTLLLGACGENGGDNPPTNNPPSATSETLSTTEDSPLSISLIAIDPDSNDTLTYLLSSPQKGTLSGQAPNLIYTPDHNVSGLDHFTFKVSDGSLQSTSATITINIDESYQWQNLSPFGGFVSSVAFHPNNSGEIWVSGDDSSGLYRSTDSGNSWLLQTTVPVDQSSYSILFDPTTPSTIYAPNHFGRGLLKSTDSGSNWQMLSVGLPTTKEEKRFFDLAIDPLNGSTLYAALSGGLYKSTNGGTSFSVISAATFGSDTDFRALAINTTRIVVGSSTGRVYTSVDQGVTWQELTTTSFLAVSDLALSSNALYIAFDLGTMTKTASFITGDFQILNNSFAANSITSAARTRLAIISGSSANTDKLYVGSVYNMTNNNWGFFESVDGGATFTRKVNGLNNESVFDLAIDPFNTNRIVYTTINGGVYITDDSGDNWRNSSQGILATDSFGFAEDPNNAQHLIMSSSAGLVGTSKIFETHDSGSNWIEIASLNNVDVMSLLFQPSNSQEILAGTFRKGIYKTSNGASSAWAQVLPTTINITRIQHDTVTPSIMYATSSEFTAPATISDTGIYTSIDSGNSWQHSLSSPLLNIAVHPLNEGEAIAVGTALYATDDHFVTTTQGLGLIPNTSGSYFSAAAFDPITPSTLLIGTGAGELYVTNNYHPDGIDINWKKLTTPAKSVAINDIEIINDGENIFWYASCWEGDTGIEADSTPGIMRSSDQGANWTFIDNGLYPSRLAWKFKKSPSVADRYYAGMWGGGFMQLDD